MIWQRIRRWWHRPDHYEWLSEYLENRGLQPYTRIGIGLIVLGGGATGLTTIWSPTGPTSDAAVAIPILAAVITTLCSLVWLTHWPRRNVSTVLVVLLDFCVTSVCLVQRDPEAGALGGFVFACLAGYVAFFHTPKYLASVALTAVVAAGICGVRLAELGNPQLAVAMFLGLSANTLILPIAVHVLVVMLGSDSVVAHLDPLTRLPNRRGFEHEMQPMLTDPRENAETSVIFIDLDNFKRVNDTLGHAAGDRVLMGVAEIIMEALPDDAVAARIGGEEFVVAVRGRHRDAVRLAEQVRRDVAAKPWSTTASVGIAQAPPGSPLLIDGLLAAADLAMYSAKRAGGNQVTTLSTACQVDLTAS